MTEPNDIALTLSVGHLLTLCAALIAIIGFLVRQIVVTYKSKIDQQMENMQKNHEIKVGNLSEGISELKELITSMQLKVSTMSETLAVTRDRVSRNHD